MMHILEDIMELCAIGSFVGFIIMLALAFQ
jgi:hypothetical protein